MGETALKVFAAWEACEGGIRVGRWENDEKDYDGMKSRREIACHIKKMLKRVNSGKMMMVG